MVALASGRYVVYGFGSRRRSPVQGLLQQYVELDITDRTGVVGAVVALRPDWVINAAAMTDVDRCEDHPGRACDVNVEGVRHLVAGCEQCGARLVQLSSDYVFDGDAGPYTEMDEPNPMNVYGRTKLASERMLQKSGVEHVIVRTAVLYGCAPHIRPNLVSWVRSALRRGETIRVATDLTSNPTLADDLAEGILTAIEKGAAGTFHMAGSDELSRYGFAQMVAREFRLDENLLVPALSTRLGLAAPRPRHSGLRSERARDELGHTFLSAKQGLRALRRQIAECEDT